MVKGAGPAASVVMCFTCSGKLSEGVPRRMFIGFRGFYLFTGEFTHAAEELIHSAGRKGGKHYKHRVDLGYDSLHGQGQQTPVESH